MFEALSDRIQDALRKLSGRGALRPEDVEAGLREVRLALLEADVNFKVARSFTESVRERAVGQEVMENLNPGQQVVKIVHEELVALLGPQEASPALSGRPPSVWMMVGLQGSGKTTSAVKLALFARKQGRRPLVAGLDRQRPAAVEQLRVLCHNNELPFVTSTAPAAELAGAALAEATRRNCDLVILDTAGRLHIDDALIGELQEIKRAHRIDSSILVADSMSGQDAVNAASGFAEKVGIDGVILTKVDGDARGGAALSIKAVTGVPIFFVGVGETVKDLEPFYPDRLASRILGMGDVLTLIEKAQASRDETRAAEMEKNLMQGRMTLNDMLEQLRQLQRMGPLEGVLGMIPGGGNLKKMLPAVPDDRELRRVEAIILSMTPEERRRPEILDGSRKRRIARGSGRTAAEVNQLLRGYEQMQQMVKMLGGAKGAKRLKRMAGRPGGIDPGMFKLP